VAGIGVVALPVGVALYAVGRIATRRLDRESWAYIPRNRQDRDRPLPLIWALAWTLALSAVAGALGYVFVLSFPSIGAPGWLIGLLGTLVGARGALALLTATRPGGARRLALALPCLTALAAAGYLAGRHIGDYSVLWHVRNIALGLPIGAALAIVEWVDTRRVRKVEPMAGPRPRRLRPP